MTLLLPNIHFGYACISTVIPNCSTAKTVPVTQFKKLPDNEARIWRMENTARDNLNNTIRLLWHNIAEGFKLYRFSSQLIPLANYPEGQIWDFSEVLFEELSKIGRIVKENNLKVSTHPGQYTVINTPNEKIFQNAILDLDYHDRVLTAMGLDENAVMAVHVGGVYQNKAAALDRFITNFQRLPVSVRKRLTIENDDTSFSIGDVLYLCEKLKCPMILDVHHHNCYNQGESLGTYLPRIFATWDKRSRPPKIHFSSPQSEKTPANHADYIDPHAFMAFLELAGNYTFDVMIEAKKQDAAVLKLWEDIGFKPRQKT